MTDSIKSFYFKYERRLSSGALLLGFIIDNLTLTRIDLLYGNLVLFSYLFVAGATIVFINAYKNENLKGWFADKLAFIAPLLMQFAFGGLFSGFVIFYSRSASLVASWPFILMLAVLLIGNEFFKRQYLRLGFQINIFYIALFSFLIFYVPVVLGEIGAWVFLISGVLSLVGIWFFVRLLRRIVPEFVRMSRAFMHTGILAIFIGINVLYFTNIIPPIPLSLKDAGVYYSIEKVNGEYILGGESLPWYKTLPGMRVVYHRAIGEPVYFYSAVFSPTDLNTTIFHSWQYFDEQAGMWIETDKISFPIVGGRDGGYRGFSSKISIADGLWRVDVENTRGQIIGRKVFEVKQGGL